MYVTLEGFVSSLWRLWTNPVYMCTMISTCVVLFAEAGGQSFIAKYLENQFSFPAWQANMYIAGAMLGTACVGTFLGGYLTKRCKMGPLVALKFTMVMKALYCASGAVVMVFKCDQPYLYNSPGPRASAETTLSGCYDDCACDDNDYFPVCGDDGRTFFSPCHAGCLQSVGTRYVNCSCIAGGTAVAGMCDYSCSMFIPYMVCVCIAALFGTFYIVPKVLTYIRAVEERDKALALGFASFMTSVTGWMLGPICFGKLIDGICIQWENSCSGSGACRLYDNDSFRFKLLGYITLFRFLGVVFMVIAFTTAKVTNKFENTETMLGDADVILYPLVKGEKREDEGENKTAIPI